jgi:hypothetical protein
VSSETENPKKQLGFLGCFKSLIIRGFSLKIFQNMKKNSYEFLQEYFGNLQDNLE